MNRFLLFIAAVCLAIPLAGAAARFEPPEGHTLLLVGSSLRFLLLEANGAS